MSNRFPMKGHPFGPGGSGGVAFFVTPRRITRKMTSSNRSVPVSEIGMTTAVEYENSNTYAHPSHSYEFLSMQKFCDYPI